MAQHPLNITNDQPGGRTRRCARASLAAALVIAALATPQVRAGPDAVLSTRSSGFVERQTAQLAPYSDAKRWRIYQKLNETFERLWQNAPVQRQVAMARTTTFPGYPNLYLQDRDGDGKADFYAYMAGAARADTQHFGAMFDLDRNGRPDWLVFFGGTILSDGTGFRPGWFSYHAVDRNADNRMDMLIIDYVDTDGDARRKPGMTAWLYDNNFDGRLDQGQHMTRGRSSAMPQQGRRLQAGVPAMESSADWPVIGMPIHLEIFDRILRDLKTAM